MIENKVRRGDFMRIGIIVNPDAGLGGRFGFKGSDGRAKEAAKRVQSTVQVHECSNALRNSGNSNNRV